MLSSSRSIFSNSSSSEPDSKSSLLPSSANPVALESRIMYAVSYPYPLGCKLSSSIIETSVGVVEPVDVEDASRTNLSPGRTPFS